MKTQALVIGNGITGRSNALALAEAGYDVTIYSKEPADQDPDTSLAAYAIIPPYIRMDDPRVEPWTLTTYDRMSQLASDPSTGVELLKMLKVKRHHEPSDWSAGLPHHRLALPDELSAPYVEGFWIDPMPVVTPAAHLRWLHERLVSLGVKFEQRVVESLDDLPAQFMHVVNCTGFGAKVLNLDEGLHADRVQFLRVRQPAQPWTTVIIEEAANTCFVPHPRAGYIQLGGKISKGTTLEPDPLVTDDIIARVEAMVPGFKVAPQDILSVTCAFRPETASGAPRVELETKRNGRRIVHCYGHDGMGYLLSVGISAYVLGLLSEID